MKELMLDATTENLGKVFDFVIEELSAHNLGKKEIRAIKLSVEEIYINIVNYAYHPDKGKARIRMDVSDVTPKNIRVEITVIDKGHPFNPLEEERPNLEAKLQDRRVGGLGIYLVRTKMDNVSYEYKDGQNILTMEKAIELAG